MTPHEKFERKYRAPKPGRTLIVGSHVYPGREDRRKLYENAIGIDMIPGEGVDEVRDLESIIQLVEFGTFDHIECRSVLEHSKKPWLLARNLELLMAADATIDISVPFVWKLHSYPSDLYRFTAEGVRELFPGIEWSALMYATQTALAEGSKSQKATVDGAVYLARSEVLGFGTRK